MNKLLLGVTLLICLCNYSRTCFSQSISSDINIELLRTPTVFLVGEMHWMKANPYYHLELFKYLYKNEGVTNIILELGSANAYLYNLYLTTGDVQYLANNVYSPFPEYKDFWMGMRELHISGEGLVVHGVDFERTAQVVQVLRLISKKEVPKEITQYLGPIINHTITEKDRYSSPSKLLKELIDHFPGHETVYRDYFGENFYVFKTIIENPIDLDKNFKKRSNVITQNIYRLVQEHEDEKFFVKIGQGHADYTNKKEVASKLLKMMGHNKLISFIPVYINCKRIHTDEIVNENEELINNKDGFNGYTDVTITKTKDVLDKKGIKKGDYAIIVNNVK